MLIVIITINDKNSEISIVVRVPTLTGKPGKPGNLRFSGKVMEKSWNFKKLPNVMEKSWNFSNLP